MVVLRWSVEEQRSHIRVNPDDGEYLPVSLRQLRGGCDTDPIPDPPVVGSEDEWLHIPAIRIRTRLLEECQPHMIMTRSRTRQGVVMRTPRRFLLSN